MTPCFRYSHYHNGNHYNNYNGGGGGNGVRGASLSRDENDSGQGSSLDKDYALYNNAQYKSSPYARANGYATSNGNGSGGQFYYNVPPQGPPPPAPAAQRPRTDGLDLTNNREYRGSAFELYKKPATSHYTYANGQSQVNR